MEIHRGQQQNAKVHVARIQRTYRIERRDYSASCVWETKPAAQETGLLRRASVELGEHLSMQPSSTGQHVMVGKAIPLAWLVRPGLPGVLTVWKASIIGGFVGPAIAMAGATEPGIRMTARRQGIFDLAWGESLPYHTGNGYDVPGGPRGVLSAGGNRASVVFDSTPANVPLDWSHDATGPSHARSSGTLVSGQIAACPNVGSRTSPG